MTASGLARTLTVRENTLVSDSSAVVGIAASVNGLAGSLREENSEESGSLKLVTLFTTGERARSSGAGSYTVVVSTLVSNRSAVVDIGLKVEGGTDTVDVVVARVTAGKLANSRGASSGTEGESTDVSESTTV